MRRPAAGLSFYLVEFLDEIAFTLLVVAMPLIRDEFGLDYAQVGLLLGVPIVVSTLTEPVLLLLGDTPLRRPILLAGGAALASAFVLIAAAPTFPLLLAAVSLSYPASGAFVSLSQVALIDRFSGRETEAMARWTAAGTVGNLLGPALVALSLAFDGTWRSALMACGLAAGLLTLSIRRVLAPAGRESSRPFPDLIRQVTANLRHVAGQRRVWLWLTLLPMSDLLLDVFFGYLALYLVDSVGLPPASAALGTTLWLGGFLLGQLAMPRLLERLNGRRLTRLSAALTLAAYPLWLLAPWPLALRLAGLAALGLLWSPWYPILKAEAYTAARGRPGSVSALESLTGAVGGVLAALVGALAARFGLTGAMLALSLGALALAVFVPRPEGARRAPG